jgi:hypothetical protein
VKYDNATAEPLVKRSLPLVKRDGDRWLWLVQGTATRPEYREEPALEALLRAARKEAR